MKIYTKVGDFGKTMYFGCGMINKNDPRIEALGALDELNSALGVALCFIADVKVKTILQEIQHDLFQVSADLAGSKLTPDSVPRVTAEHIQKLELLIDELEEKLGMPKKFILPGGTQASAFLHLARTITRRAERSIVTVKEVIEVNQDILKYVNRLSDLLYVLARQANKEVDIQEQQPIYKYMKRED